MFTGNPTLPRTHHEPSPKQDGRKPKTTVLENGGGLGFEDPRFFPTDMRELYSKLGFNRAQFLVVLVGCKAFLQLGCKYLGFPGAVLAKTHTLTAGRSNDNRRRRIAYGSGNTLVFWLWLINVVNDLWHLMMFHTESSGEGWIRMESIKRSASDQPQD